MTGKVGSNLTEEEEARFRIEAKILRRAAEELARRRATTHRRSVGERQLGEESVLFAEDETRFQIEAERLRRAAEELTRKRAGTDRRSADDRRRTGETHEPTAENAVPGSKGKKSGPSAAQPGARSIGSRAGRKSAKEKSPGLYGPRQLVGVRKILESNAHIPADEHPAAIPSIGFAARIIADASARVAAVGDLAHFGGHDSFPLIVAAFDDPVAAVRCAAARALHDLRPDPAGLFTRALREATVERRRRIGEAMAQSGLANSAINNLAVESRQKTYKAFSLLFLMAKAGEVQPLVQAIEGHPTVDVRLAVVKLLALSGGMEIVPAFRRLAVSESLPSEVRSAVIEAIYQISSQSRETAPSAP